MRVAIGSRIIDGPWGGGNLFAKHLTAHLKAQGMEVVHGLQGAAPDVAILTHATASDSASFTAKDLALRLLLPGWDPVVIHRINNSSDARNDDAHAFNKGRIRASRLADHTVFLSRWLYRAYARDGFSGDAWSVIFNGGEDGLFRPRAGERDPSLPLSIVTHHWSNNAKKGFAIYRALDEYLAECGPARPFTFTYIGRLPENFRFSAAIHKEPMSPAQLAVELPRYDIYLTAAQNEAAGMHHIEGALCGLPILYLESGGIPEYCEGFGLAFTPETFFAQLDRIRAEYPAWRARMSEYPHTAGRMCRSYADLIRDLAGRRAELRAARGSRRWEAAKLLTYPCLG